MRILFLDQFSEPGGAQLCLQDEMSAVLNRGWFAEFLAPGNGALFEFCRDQSIPAKSLPWGRYTQGSKTSGDVLRYSFDVARAGHLVRAAVARSRIDLVVANGPRILPAAIGAGCAVILHLHSRLDKRYARDLVRWSLSACGAGAICCSAFVAEPVGAKCVAIVYNGVRDTGFTLKPVERTPRRIGIIGRIAPEKGHLDFVNVARTIAASRPGIRWAIYGASLFSDPSYESHVRSVAAGAPVDFHGWADDIPQILGDLDILVVPSKSAEATPRVIMEAMASGTPVVAYPSGGIPELIRHGATGLLTKVPEPESLAQSIENLLSDPELRVRLAHNARREWEDRFQVSRYQREMCELFEQACHRSPKEGRKSQSAAAIAGKDDFV